MSKLSIPSDSGGYPLHIGNYVKYNNDIWEIIDINNLNPKEIYYRLSNCPCDKCNSIWVMDNYIEL